MGGCVGGAYNHILKSTVQVYTYIVFLSSTRWSTKKYDLIINIFLWMMTEVWDIVYDLEEKSPCLFVKNGER